MSMNPKKDANRAESRRGGGYGDGNAASPRTGQQVFQSKEATTNAYPTRAAANIRHGAGEVAGAGERLPYLATGAGWVRVCAGRHRADRTLSVEAVMPLSTLYAGGTK